LCHLPLSRSSSTIFIAMTSSLLPCDGCGQPADSAHISRRLERLAWSTRFRPLHIQALLLAGIAPRQNSDFLYAPDALFEGEAAALLKAIQLSAEGKSRETVLAEFQKLGLMLTYVLECPLDDSASPTQAHALLEKRLPATLARIRRSLKPKRVLLLSTDLLPVAQKLHEATLPCPVLPPTSGVFLSSRTPSGPELLALRAALAPSSKAV
jgi:hypothetical protein